MKYVIILVLLFILLIGCSEKSPTSPDRLDIRYEIIGTDGSVAITYLFDHFYLDSTKSIPWNVSFSPGGITTSVNNPSGTFQYDKNEIVYIRARRINDDLNGEPQSITATIYINEKVYKTATAHGYNVSVKVGGWYGI